MGMRQSKIHKRKCRVEAMIQTMLEATRHHPIYEVRIQRPINEDKYLKNRHDINNPEFRKSGILGFRLQLTLVLRADPTKFKKFFIEPNFSLRELWRLETKWIQIKPPMPTDAPEEFVDKPMTHDFLYGITGYQTWGTEEREVHTAKDVHIKGLVLYDMSALTVDQIRIAKQGADPHQVHVFPQDLLKDGPHTGWQWTDPKMKQRGFFAVPLGQYIIERLLWLHEHMARTDEK
jgi:hypothetical protein